MQGKQWQRVRLPIRTVHNTIYRMGVFRQTEWGGAGIGIRADLSVAPMHPIIDEQHLKSEYLLATLEMGQVYSVRLRDRDAPCVFRAI